MGSYVCLPSCVPHASTVLSKHRVGVEPLFCLGFWDRGCACARGGRGTQSQNSDNELNQPILHTENTRLLPESAVAALWADASPAVGGLQGGHRKAILLLGAVPTLCGTVPIHVGTEPATPAGKGACLCVGPDPLPQGCIGRGGGPPPPSRAPSPCPATVSLTASASLSGICTRQNRPQPLWKSPPTAHPTAFGAASEAPPPNPSNASLPPLLQTPKSTPVGDSSGLTCTGNVPHVSKWLLYSPICVAKPMFMQ